MGRPQKGTGGAGGRAGIGGRTFIPGTPLKPDLIICNLSIVTVLATLLATLLVMLSTRTVYKFARDASKAFCDTVPVVLYSPNFVFKSFNDGTMFCDDPS